MEAKNLYARHSNLSKNRIRLSYLRTLLLIGLILVGVSSQAQTTVQYSQSFTAGALASPAACNAWTTFRASLNGYVFSSVTISGSLNGTGVTCSDPTTTNAIANALYTGSNANLPQGGHVWQIGGCSTTNCGPGNVELDVDGTVGGSPATTCGCNSGGFSIRPNYGVAGWWGGIGSNCSGVSQTLTLTFNIQPVSFVKGTVNGSGVFEIGDTLCANSGASSINSLLTVSDRTGLTETWSVNTLAAHGTVNGLPVTAPSAASVSPSGVTYTPTAGFSGVDSFKIQVNNGTQTAIANITVLVNPGPSTSVAGISYCPGGSGTLTASGATTYTWAPATGLSATTGTSVTANPTVTTTYTITGTTGACSGTTTAQVTVNPLPTIGTSVGSGTATCAGTATAITATGASTYIWSPSTGLSATTGATVSANPLSNQTYTITGTSAAGCSNTGTVSVTVNPLPLISGGSNTSVCLGNNTTLTASGATTYSWSPAAGLSATTGTSVVASPTATTTYSVTGTITATGCQRTALVTVSVNPVPTISATGSGLVTICSGSSATLTATGGVSYTWSPSAGLSATSGSTVTANPTTTTTYQITGTNSFGCSNSSSPFSEVVSVNPLPSPITGNTMVSTTITTQLSDATGSGTWTSSVPANATVNGASGLVSGVAPGTTVITYTLPTTCSVNTVVNVNAASVGLNFNGTTSYVQLGNLLTGGQSYTKEAWINVPSTVANTNIISSPDAPFYIQSGHLQAANNYLSAPTFAIDPGTFPTGQWVYVAVTYDQPSNTMKLYRNGVLVATNTTSATYAVGNYDIGAYGGAYLNNETVDEVRIWNVARSQAQLQASMNCDIPQQAGLIAYYRFDEGVAGGNNTSKAYVLDYSGNGNCGTLTGFALTGPGSNFETGAVGDCSPISITVPAATNTGTATVCIGQTTTLSNSVSGGLWASGNTGTATVNASTGVVTGVAGGTVNITYTLNCGTAITPVTVYPAPSPITGTPLVCASGGNTTLSNATTPGIWTSSNGNATIGSASGIVTGVTAGNTTITYTLTDGCIVTAVITVNPLPVITGSPNTTICLGQSANLTAGGGVSYSWAPSDGLSTTAGSAVTASPTVTTTYTVTGTGPVAGLPALSYVQSFTGGSVPTTQCTAWATFLASFSSTTTYTGFTIKGSLDATGYTCTDPVVATAIANALSTGTAATYSSDGHTWYVGTGCGGGCGGSGSSVELAVDQGTCACGSVAAVRPQINNTNWGGLGTTCSAPSQTLEVDFYTGISCTNTATITVSVNPLPTISTSVGSGTAICNGSSTTITASGAVNYTWSPSVALSATTGATVTANPSSYQSYEITGTDINGCSNTASVDVSVNPLPASISGSLNFCLGSVVSLSDGSGGGTWTSSNNAVATVDAFGNVSGVATGVDTITYTLPTSCSTWVSGTVNPLSDVTVSPLIGQTVCNGASTTPVIFTGSVAGTEFDWTNTLPSIGIPASGSDTIFSVSAVNTSFVSDTGYFTVTPYNNGCPGTPGSFYIAVNPTPDVFASNPPQTLCNGTMTAPISFAGDVAGTIFTWTNTNSSIGISASGSGNIASFAGIDTSAQVLTSVITVNTSAAGCTGSSNSFTITIDPTPLLIGSLASTICNNTLFNYIPSSLTLDSTFTWTRAAVAGISEPASAGTNNTNEYLDDTSLVPVNVTYVYVVQANGCTDTADVVVTVNPTPHLISTLTPAAVCDSAFFRYSPISNVTSGITFTWSRALVAGISNPAASGIDTIKEYLVNTTPNPVAVPYVDTMTYFGCKYTNVITATVNPKPLLSTPVSLPQICDSSTLTYVPASATTGTTFTWSRAAIAGNPASSGVDTISEMLVNTTTNSVIVTYVDTLKANGCWNAEDVTVRVMPTPLLSSSLDSAMCDSSTFNYTPMSATPGTAFTWARPFVIGIINAPESGIGNPNEELINTTNDNLNVTYIYTLNDSGCTHVQDVAVTVHPTPVLSSPLTSEVCSGMPYVYGPLSYTAGTTFSWKRGSITGITPATDSGSGVSISETLVNGTNAPIVTGYLITLKANGCPNRESITLTVDPTPASAAISTFAEGQICTGTAFQNFGTSTPAPAGVNYIWSVNNAVIEGHGSGNQYILVSFNNSGAASVVLTTDINAYGCKNYSAVNYTVSSSAAQTPDVIYFNGQFVCLQNNLVHYQWGFDDAITLDSTLIPGEVNPNYFNNGPDLTYKYYWVATTDSGGCTQKTYFNVPTGITKVSAPVAGDIKVYPNPANEELNVVFNNSITGKLEAEVVNILGQKLMSAVADDHKAMLNVASLPAGTYMVVCYSNGIKLTAVRFVKN
jgi:hypothetical protein